MEIKTYLTHTKILLKLRLLNNCVTSWIPSSENTYDIILLFWHRWVLVTWVYDLNDLDDLDLPDMLTPPDDLTCLWRPDDALAPISDVTSDSCPNCHRRPVWSLRGHHTLMCFNILLMSSQCHAASVTQARVIDVTFVTLASSLRIIQSGPVWGGRSNTWPWPPPPPTPRFINIDCFFLLN